MARGLLTEWAACGRLDRPPHESCYLKLPDDFGLRFAVFVDTEEEFDWSQPLSREARSTRAAESLPLVHRRLRSHGVEPVYLIDHPIATDIRCVATLREYQENGECVVGTQLHPWVNPPFEEELCTYNSFVGNLPIALEYAKIERLTEAIEQGFGRRPTVYRAGRYGVGPNTAQLLLQAGYTTDVSVRALYDYSGEGGPDFSGVRPTPYYVGDGALLEVPLTAGYIGALRNRGGRLYAAARRVPRAHGLLARTGLLGRVALTPEDMPLGEVLEAIDRLIDDGLQLFSISFHSPSVEPGHTPYVRTRADLDLFYAWWDGVFDRFARRGIAPASLAQIEAAAARAREGRASLAKPAAAPLSAGAEPS
ncbi:MAG TPA: polysaccharide deacetylase family protein [Allosphingosinicella sp.]|nr:polysaccharide deacetylase family protein [Allosphingosinicella sp.]